MYLFHNGKNWEEMLWISDKIDSESYSKDCLLFKAKISEILGY